MRLFVNFFYPSFKLAEKAREGAKVRKRYNPAVTPYQRLWWRTRGQVRRYACGLSPARHVRSDRAAADDQAKQQRLVEIADRPVANERAKPTTPSLEAFLTRLRAVWQGGPTTRPNDKAKRLQRRPDPFATVTAQLRAWFTAKSWRASCEMLERLQAEQLGCFPSGQLRTLQRPVRRGARRRRTGWYSAQPRSRRR